MNRRTSSHAIILRPDRPRWLDVWLLGMLAIPPPALAQLSLTTAANTQYEYNSNVFGLQHGYTFPGVTTPPYGDSFVAYGGKLDASYLWNQQQLRATITGAEYRYDRFSILNHSNYTVDGAWKWQLEDALDGLVDVTRVRSLVDVYNVTQAQVVQQTQQRETGKIGIRLPAHWRAELSGYTEHDQEPLLNAPHLSLTETSGQAAVKYVGTAGLAAGLTAGYLHGNFDGAGEAVTPAYHQTDVALTATYGVSDVSAFSGRVGYSKRASAAAVVGGINSISGTTWDLHYRRALTGKTTTELKVSRLITSYITNTGSVITSVAALKAEWQATSIIGVTLDYNFAYQQMPGQGGTFDGPFNGTNRTDRFNFAGLSIRYDPFTWFSVRPYGRFQSRRSKNFAGGDFDSSAVGVQFTLQWQRGEPPPPSVFEMQPL